ncbi:MAG: hypothetical protein JXR83_12440, partial [Deltaproteobacteria bacterium]|nr:hypothetical protein [Deltaproteobacteria bacterium]
MTPITCDRIGQQKVPLPSRRGLLHLPTWYLAFASTTERTEPDMATITIERDHTLPLDEARTAIGK